MGNHDAFVRWFEDATGQAPYPFQTRFACGTVFSQLKVTIVLI